MSTTTYPHIEVRDGVAYVEGTRIKVVTLALEHLANHWEAEALRRQHPPLSLGQVHSALAYYYDHQLELDQVIEARLREEDSAIEQIDASPLQQRLRDLKRANAK